MKKIFIDALSSGLILGFFIGLFRFKGPDSILSLFVIALVFALLSTLYYYYISRESKIQIKGLILFVPVFLISSMFMYIVISGLLIAGV